jgi:hypothetical protein
MRAEQPADALKKLLYESEQAANSMSEASISSKLEARGSKLFL